MALERSTPITTAVLSYLEVPITAIVALFFLNEEFSSRSVTGIVLILTGALLVSLDQAKDNKIRHEQTPARIVQSARLTKAKDCFVTKDPLRFVLDFYRIKPISIGIQWMCSGWLVAYRIPSKLGLRLTK